ncbi:MAG: Ku protein [Planctomycetaceae bacterium]|nr:Ku protein [Planctomycetaceae bacterium]
MARKKSADKSSSRNRGRGGPRASWKGNLTFGLVSFGVEAFNAVDRSGSDIHFHQLHAECHSRIHYEKVCPIHGTVSNDEIVSGYEVSKGKYIEVDPDELDALRTTTEKALRIDAFIPPGTIDPLYFDGRMYYLVPASAESHESYSVILAAMRHEQREAVGRIVFSGKDQVVLIRALDGVLHMAMLNYSAEIRPPEEAVSRKKKVSAASRQVKLAQTLIREWSETEFDFSQYEDTYRERVGNLIEAKKKGEKLVAPEEDEEEPETINLMEALKRSLEKAGTKRTRKTAAKKRRRRSA